MQFLHGPAGFMCHVQLQRVLAPHLTSENPP